MGTARVLVEANSGVVDSQEWLERMRMVRAELGACREAWSNVNQKLQDHKREHGCDS